MAKFYRVQRTEKEQAEDKVIRNPVGIKGEIPWSNGLHYWSVTYTDHRQLAENDEPLTPNPIRSDFRCAACSSSEVRCIYELRRGDGNSYKERYYECLCIDRECGKYSLYAYQD